MYRTESSSIAAYFCRLLQRPHPIGNFDVLYGGNSYKNAGEPDSRKKTITPGKNEYLMLGDNSAPNRSFDSRFFGAVNRSNILGKVKTIYWPFNRIGAVD
ncbi:hypothetical protein EGM51_10140 [Verrucomicrobia bacterium S94]|nr:hypothetical protein EGM51_10140 [Verrucomicrobia bacterium S94]